MTQTVINQLSSTCISRSIVTPTSMAPTVSKTIRACQYTSVEGNTWKEEIRQKYAVFLFSGVKQEIPAAFRKQRQHLRQNGPGRCFHFWWTPSTSMLPDQTMQGHSVQTTATPPPAYPIKHTLVD